MVELNPDSVRFIIQHLREFQAEADDVGDDAPEFDEDGIEEAVETISEERSTDALRSIIDDLEPDQQITLVALLWLGRGDYTLDEWDETLAEARSAYNGRAAAYVMSTPLAADYLEEGLLLHGYDED